MTNPLGDFLRARRELVTPESVGIPHGRRRVKGLRREELAVLAGISPDYYTRIEQGRDRNPSAQILSAIARVLQLDAEATAYLHELGRPLPSLSDRSNDVSPGVASLLRQLPFPAFVQDRVMTVLAANALATRLSPHFRPGVNLLRAVFLDPDARELHPDWERATEQSVSGLRSLAGPDVEEPRFVGLIEELSAASARFRDLWSRQDVREKVGGVSEWNHPVAGAMTLQFEKLVVAGTDGHLLVVYHAEADSPAHEALGRLAEHSQQAASPEPVSPVTEESAC